MSHAQLPTPMPIGLDSVRVFFATRNKEQRSHIAFADLHIGADGAGISVKRVCDVPVLSPGPIGHFDEHGVFPSSIISYDGQYYMYYIGWNQGAEAPMFYSSIGLAVSDDGENFSRVSQAPLLARGEHDPCLVTSPHVQAFDQNWQMWYVSGINWFRDTYGKLHSRYHIKQAHAANPFDWKRDGAVSIELKPSETNVARPTVFKTQTGRYVMLYSYVDTRIGYYRIGCAYSEDSIQWQRLDDNAGIQLDSHLCRHAACYPAIFQLGKRTYILYNGDNFGRHGFVVASLKETF